MSRCGCTLRQHGIVAIVVIWMICVYNATFYSQPQHQSTRTPNMRQKMRPSPWPRRRGTFSQKCVNMLTRNGGGKPPAIGLDSVMVVVACGPTCRGDGGLLTWLATQPYCYMAITEPKDEGVPDERSGQIHVCKRKELAMTALVFNAF